MRAESNSPEDRYAVRACSADRIIKKNQEHPRSQKDTRRARRWQEIILIGKLFFCRVDGGKRKGRERDGGGDGGSRLEG